MLRTDSADLWMGAWAQASEGTLPHYVYRPFKKKLEGNCEARSTAGATVSDFLTVGPPSLPSEAWIAAATSFTYAGNTRPRKAHGQEGIDRSHPYEIIQHLRKTAP
jgi:hypothetical protein